MAATSLLARLGFRSALVGSAASLVYAAPVADGDVSNDAHTHAGRTGWYHPTATSMCFVSNAVDRLRLDDAGVTVLTAENHAIIRVNGDTVLDATHYTVEVDASGGPVTITLPDSTGAGVNGRMYNIVKVDNSANAVILARSGADLISGATSQSITAQWQARTVQARAATPGYSIL